MGKFLRVLVVFFFLLSIAALVFGIMLFNKRELVKRRTLQLENYIRKLALTIEKEQAPEQTVAYPARDESGVSASDADRFESDPQLIQRSAFWDTYEAFREKAQNPTVVFTEDMNRQIQEYYYIDPATGETVRDAQGYKQVTGAGTMNELLEDVLDKATKQQARLDATRQMLKLTREYLVETIEKLNSRKRELRDANQTIRQRDATIAQLEGEVSRLKGDVARLEKTVRDKEDEIARLTTELEEKQNQLDEANEEIEELDETVKDLRGQIEELLKGQRDTITDTQVTRQAGTIEIDPGIKGTVKAVDSEYNFVIIKLSDEFADKMRASYDPEKGGLPAVELIVTRKDSMEFVTKVRLTEMRENNLAIANILPQWQQLPVEAGDDVSLR
jgi:predicted  nucleic acid-binding Zn-ribbon protein